MNITIINTVAINGGDEALLKATIYGIKKNIDNPYFHFLSNNPQLSNKQLKDLSFDWDWEYVFRKRGTNESKIFFKIKSLIRKIFFLIFKVSYYNKLSILFASKDEKRIFEIFKKTDQFILAPGGYLNDFYGFEQRINTVKLINYLNKPYHIFSQSLGPFNKDNDHTNFINFLEQSKSIIVRENYSLNNLRTIGFKGNIYVGTDVAFLLSEKFSFKKKIKPKGNIALNFRDWEFEIDAKDNYSKALSLCKYLINKKKYKLFFISTCQGVKGYRDDSNFALKIWENLSETERLKVEIIKTKFTLTELISEFSKYDFYIGMRLHGAILSMISGIPALNIAYENKTPGIYEQMNMQDYCFSYKESIYEWINYTDNFIKDYKIISCELDNKLFEMAVKANLNFEILHKAIVDE